MKDKCITSIDEYVHIISELNAKYLENSTGYVQDSPYIYRGMNSCNFELLPSIFRGICNYDFTIENDIENYKYNLRTEKSILRSFISKSAFYLPNIPEDNYSVWLQYAQHYGTPTRLLDWTTNSLIALYFACNNAFECIDIVDEKEHTTKKSVYNECDAVIYVLDEYKYRKQDFFKNVNIGNKSVRDIVNSFYKSNDRKIEIEYPVVYHTNYIDNRMLAQSGCFMLWGNRMQSLEHLLSKENYLSIDEFVNTNIDCDFGDDSKANEKFILKILIKGTCKRKILYDLNSFGVNSSLIFPGLDGIGKHVENNARYKHYI